MTDMTHVNEDNKTLNNLVYLYPLISTVFSILFKDLGLIISLLFAIWFFINDRRYLRSINVFVPHWGWFFIFPVYIYKRQNRNGWSKKYFWYYLLINVALIVLMVIIGANQNPYTYR